jgi:class 3 adenylate cyclase
VKAAKTQYAKSGNVHVAYQVIGDGPVDIVLAPGIVSHLDVYWENPDLVEFFRGITEFARLILFDKRGTGLSDRAVGIPTLEDRIDDIRAVMSAAGSYRAVIAGLSEGASMAILFAATYPEKTMGLIDFAGIARVAWAPDYPWGQTREDYVKESELAEKDWDAMIKQFAESLAPSKASDPTFKEWVDRLSRYGSSPGSIVALDQMNWLIDLRSVLPSVHVPTLVLHPIDDHVVRIEHGRYIAEHIPGAKLVEYPSTDHLFFVNPGTRAFVMGEIRKFVRNLRPSTESDRVLATILFSDIVDSTRQALQLGDVAWGKLLERYKESAQTQLSAHRGQLIKMMGDGLLAIFDGPTRAVHCACALRDQVRSLGLGVRAGLHTGECILREGDVEGIAVHIAERITALANKDEVLVSRTVRDITAGSNIAFKERGSRVLKGLEGGWETYSAQIT